MIIKKRELAILNKLVVLSIKSSGVDVHDCIRKIHLKISEAILCDNEKSVINFTYEELVILNKIISIAQKLHEIETNW